MNDVKNFLRVDDDIIDDDVQIKALMDAAQQYITEQTGKQYKDDYELWNTCVKLLVAHWYDNRQPMQSRPGTIEELPHSVTAIIRHISLCGSYQKIGETS